MAWQDDYYLGSSDYPSTGGDDDIDPATADDFVGWDEAAE